MLRTETLGENMTRKVIYLTESGEDHRFHSITLGHTGRKRGAEFLVDGGMALPEKARASVVFCITCARHLVKGDEYRVEERFNFEIQTQKEEDDAEPWK